MSRLAYWIVNVHQFGRPDFVVAFAEDHTAAVRFAEGQIAAGHQANAWNMMGGLPPDRTRRDRK